MKFLKRMVFALVLSSAFIACSKDDVDNNSKPNPDAAAFAGKWVGSYGFGSSNSDDYFSLVIKTNGVIQEIGEHSGAPTGQGTWTIEGNTLTGQYKMLWSPYNQYGVKLTINASTGKMEGSWGTDGSTTSGGKVLLTKQ